MNEVPPVALTIAGSDSCAGAGMQADLKTFGALGVYGLTAVTAVVAEVPGRVTRIQGIEPEVVAEQVRLAFAAYPVRAVKTGMLFSREIIEAVASVMEGRGVPLVIDPVMVATSGDALLQSDAVEAYRQLLFPMATIITPNLDEVRVLLGREIRDAEEMRIAGRELREMFGAPVLMKGGHLAGAEALDWLVTREGEEAFASPFVPGVHTHGTGCTLSAAIAAGLARGEELSAAVAAAKRFVTRAIEGHFRWVQGESVTDALDHSNFGDT